MDLVLLSDEVFRFLCRFTVVENFYKRALTGTQYEGMENASLIGTLIVRDVPVVMKHVKQDTIFTPIKGIDLKQKIVREAYLDGAYIIDRRCISNKVFLQSFISDVMRYRRIATIEELQQRYLPQDFLASGNAVAVETPMIGSRTQAALAAGLWNGRGYLVKQTAYAGLPVGKVCMFNSAGLAMEFFLREDPGRFLNEDAYFDQSRCVVGVLRVYGVTKTDRKEYRVTPADLGIEPSNYLPKQGFWGAMLERFPMLRSGVTTNLFR